MTTVIVRYAFRVRLYVSLNIVTRLGSAVHGECTCEPG